jgi:acetyl esterase/lipase
MAKRGFLFFNLNYRLALSGVKVTDQMADVRKATTWIYKNMDQYNGDRNQVFLCGHSAGAVLATIEALLAQNARLREVFNIHDRGFDRYDGIILDCGMMTFYQRTPNYWGMRKMVFEKNYRRSIYYKNMVWENIDEISSLPKTYLISNEKDALKHMTLKFNKLLEDRKVPHCLNYGVEEALGHMAIIYDPESAGCSKVIDGALRFFQYR